MCCTLVPLGIEIYFVERSVCHCLRFRLLQTHIGIMQFIFYLKNTILQCRKSYDITGKEKIWFQMKNFAPRQFSLLCSNRVRFLSFILSFVSLPVFGVIWQVSEDQMGEFGGGGGPSWLVGRWSADQPFQKRNSPMNKL
jgi:hypothetical protein